MTSGERRRPTRTLRTTCRVCREASLHRFLSLGPQPLANAFLRNEEEASGEGRFPLDLYFCTTCTLVQLADVIDPESLFGEYIYVTGTSTTIAAHNRRYAAAVRDELLLGEHDLVVEVASNDGSLLERFQELGTRVLGVEPARNIAALAVARGIPTENRFFGEEAGAELRESHGEASAVIGNNVLAHVDDTLGFLRGCAALVRDGGRVVVEVPYVREMLLRTEYDTVYHEHLCYFSVTALARCGAEAGLGIVRVDEVPVHGGSIRVWFAKGVAHGEQPGRMMEEERANGVATLAAWEEFAVRTAGNRRALRMMLEELRGRGKSVAGYGAPAKGNTLLNYCGIDTTLLPYTVDRNPMKVGMLTPGMHIPVRGAEAIQERRPDYLLILAWNFADEIMDQQRAYREAGGRFIVPIPTPTVI
jgi:SAM-dependent methyltransferase